MRSLVSWFHSSEQPRGPLGRTGPAAESCGWGQLSTWASSGPGSCCVTRSGPSCVCGGQRPGGPPARVPRPVLGGLRTLLQSPPAQPLQHVSAPHPRGHGARRLGGSASHLTGDSAQRAAARARPGPTLGSPSGAAPAGQARQGLGCAPRRALAEAGTRGLLDWEGTSRPSRACGSGARTRLGSLLYKRGWQP